MRLASHLMTLASLLAILVAAPARAGQAVTRPDGVSPFKFRQMRMLAEEPMHERREHAEQREHARELRRLARRLRTSGRSTLHVQGERARRESMPEGPPVTGPAPATARIATPQSARAIAALLPNVRCNDTSGDLVVGGLGEGQCETAIARWNNYLVAAWNDGKGYDDGTFQTLGWATSTDGGLTWIDHGTFPIPAAYSTTWTWTSDPVLAVNSTTGAFYFAGLGEVTGLISGAGVLKGRFTGSAFAWEPPSLARVVNWSSNFIDKEWIAVDPADGRVHLSYSNFTSAGSQIETQYADSALASWSATHKISTDAENGWVQGSRPIVGPGGVVYVAYYRIGTVDADVFRISRSGNRGDTFTTPNDAVSFYPNPGSGAPGFNRPQGIQFPSIAVDRSGGAHGGRLFLAWNEALNWYDDAGGAGTGGDRNEVEPNGAGATATPAVLGQVLRGTSTDVNDFDYFAVPLTAGQTILAMVSSLSNGQTVRLRMIAPDGLTLLAFVEESYNGLVTWGPAPWIFTAPTTGTYYVRVTCVSGSGPYQVRTGPASRASERGRDQRDVFTSWSDNGGVSWSTPVRMNQDAVGYDGWLPEVAVAPDGQVACAWYDWRDATASTAGGESSVYLATSEDGGATWTEKGAITDARTAWTNVSTNIVPNEGDYISMFASQEGLAVAWSDGRGGTPDTWMEWIASDRPVATRAEGVPGRIDLEWFMDRTPGTTAGLYRQVGSASTWDSIATLTLDATKHFSYTDTVGVVLGQVYRYQLGVVTSGTERFYPFVSVQVGAPSLALAGAWPNPAHQDALITFTLRDGSPATLTMLDLNGRRVFSRQVSGLGRQQIPLAQGKRIEPGIYFLRLEQGGKKVSRRIVVV
jgi:hypothetical protein